MTTIWFQLTTANGKREVKKELGNRLRDYDPADLLVYASAEALEKDKDEPEPKHFIDPRGKVDTLKDTEENPLLIVVPERVQPTTSDESQSETLQELGRKLTRIEQLQQEALKKRKKDTVPASQINDREINSVLNSLGFAEIQGDDTDFEDYPRKFAKPYIWGPEVEWPQTSAWFSDALDIKSLPNVKVKNAQNMTEQRVFEGAEVNAISGKPDLVITIKNNPICFIELKKEPEEGLNQVKAEALLFLDSARYLLDRIAVLTDLKDFWQILFFMSLEGKEGLYIGKVSRDVALGVIHRWIVRGGHQYKGIMGRELRGFAKFADLPTLPGPLEMHKTITLPVPAEILQLHELRGLADDEAEDCLLRNRQRLLLYANYSAPSAEPMYREMAAKLATETHKRDNYISYIS
ncbi:hypothetical protein DFS34DRAFT_698008 [Phlyctochytrium arcticum]|nr:hypothetical protein DFS34DRAFT_698008 [Phlyctochytrium arcticum]